MKVVLTGATGLIGMALGERLSSAGDEIHALVRKPIAPSTKFPMQTHIWDSLREPAPAKALIDCHVLIHLAGENIASRRWSERRKQELKNSRVVTAKNLRDGFIQLGQKPKLVFAASAVGYYGDRGDEFLMEQSQPGRDFLAQLCVEWEHASMEIPSERTVIGRFGIVLSSQGGFLTQVKRVMTKFGASRLGSGMQWVSWIHIEDLVEAICHTLRHDNLNGPVNCVAPCPVQNVELTKHLAKYFGVFQGLPVPKFALRLFLGERSQALLTSQRVSPEKLLKGGFVFRYPDVAAALRSLS